MSSSWNLGVAHRDPGSERRLRGPNGGRICTGGRRDSPRRGDGEVVGCAEMGGTAHLWGLLWGVTAGVCEL